MFRRSMIWLSSFVLIALALGGLRAPHSAAHAQSTAAWTIMLYSTADTSDIEDGMMLDVNEVEWVGSTADVNLVAQVDRTDADPSWTDARRFLLEQDSDPMVVNSPVLESLGEVDMGDPNTLVDFVTWATTNYPADHYALILSDHGGAWTGVGWDVSSGSDQLTMPELDQAFSQITGELGRPLDLIGFDACLMSQFDVIRLLAPYADYAVLAEETEPAYGWAYDLTLRKLIDDPSMSADALGQSFAEDYYYSYNEGPWQGMEDLYDLNVIDLSGVPDAVSALDNFVQVMGSNSSDILAAIGDARNNTVYFGGRTPDEADAFSSVDLINFLTLLTDISDNSDVDQAAQALIDATNSLIVFHQASPAMDRASGVSIYFPSNESVYQGYGYNYPDEVSYMGDWQGFLSAFYGEAAVAAPAGSVTNEDVVSIQGVYPGDVVSIYQPPVVLFDTNGTNILDVSFSATLQMDDGTQITLDESPLQSSEITESGESIVSFPDGPQQHQFTWGAEMPVITDGLVGIPTLLLSNPNNPDVQLVSGEYITPDGSSVTAYLVFDNETQTVSEVWGVSDTGTAPFNIQPDPGDQFLPTWRYYDENGDVSLVPAVSDPLTFGGEPFSYHFEPAVSGDYLFTIRMEDIAGNVYIASTPITVDNEGLDINYRGYTDTDLGLNFLYPWDWPEPLYVVSDDGSSQAILNNPDESVHIYVTAVDAASTDDVLNSAYAYLDNIEGVVYDVAGEEPVTVSGYDGTIIPYSFTSDGEAHVGLLLAVFVPDPDTGFLVDLDALEPASDEGQAAFNTMIGSLNFFAPTEAQ